ncbi:hypothetical protein LX32DRAFT_217626 [Colletotrichum zoysiae]|uniref:Uncharacterized protein n=1 Tax=Colletotrichum zoysiae TaxID=1216348 RepID=A0AAD9M828_9PEZI|nr:hypothetical protein LX32DRAFT_217626 [Colletotrichum zoysiae]
MKHVEKQLASTLGMTKHLLLLLAAHLANKSGSWCVTFACKAYIDLHTTIPFAPLLHAMGAVGPVGRRNDTSLANAFSMPSIACPGSWILSSASLMTQEPVAWRSAMPVLRTTASQYIDKTETPSWLITRPAQHRAHENQEPAPHSG